MLNTELLADGGIVAVIGLLTVFLVLIVLWGLLELMRVIFARIDKAKAEKEQKERAKDAAPASAAIAPAAANKVKDTIQDEELVAVITAAIAASLNTSSYNLHITSLRRTNNWKNTARQENVF